MNNQLNSPDKTPAVRGLAIIIIAFFIFKEPAGALIGSALLAPVYYFVIPHIGLKSTKVVFGIYSGIVAALYFRFVLLESLRGLFTLTWIPGQSSNINPLPAGFLTWHCDQYSLVAAPVFTLALLLLLFKTPLADRIGGWDTPPKDPKKVFGGKHRDDAAFIGRHLDRHRCLHSVWLPFFPGKHILTVATSGGGKTACISDAIEYNAEFRKNGKYRGVIVVDGKADKNEYSLYQLMKREARRTGRKLHIIDIADPKEKIDIFDGMDAIGIKDSLMSMTEWTEPHYESSAALFYSILAELLLLADEEAVSFSSLSFFCDSKELNGLIRKLEKEGKLNPERAEEYRRIVARTADIASSAAPRFETLAHGVGERLFPKDKTECDNALKICDAYQNDDLVLVMINTLAYSSYSFSVANLILSSIKCLLSQIQNGQQEKKGIFLVLDELGQYISNNVTQIYAMGRSAGIQACGIVQSLSNLSKGDRGEQVKSEIISNSKYIINFCITNPDDAEELARIYSTEQAPEVTTQISGEMKSGMGSLKLVDQFRVHPRLIKDLPEGVGYIAYKGASSPGPFRFTLRFVNFDE